MKLVKKFNYPKLSRVTTKSGRLYSTPERDKLPSVTTILDKTADKSGLLEWRKRVGEAEANRIVREAAKIGSLLHGNLEDYMQGKTIKTKGNLVHKLVKNMTDSIIANGLNRISEIYGIESYLYFPGLYAGTADLIANIDDSIAIIDFKNSRSNKKEEHVEDYFLQGCAYAIAHNELFGTNIDKVVIMMVVRPKENDRGNLECKYKEFEISGDRFKEYSEKWLDRLEQYYESY